MSIEDKKIKQELLTLYDEYAHNGIDRRQFLDKLSMYAVGGLTVPTLLDYLMPKYEENLQVPSKDPRVDAEYITYDSPNGGGSMKGLLSKPANNQSKLPGIIVVHENRGLNPNIEDVGRRCALSGFISLAPDALTPLGGYPGNDDDGRKMQSELKRENMLEDFISAFYTLMDHPQCNGNVGVVGFCFGGWISNMMAVRVPELKAAVPFYGSQAPIELVRAINAPLMLQYAEFDERVNAGWPAYETALKANNKAYEVFFYPGTNHGFHNDSTPRYDVQAAALAWERTIVFFTTHLK